MILDCHVHVSACTPAHGSMSPKLLGSVPFRYMRWKFGLVGNDASTEEALAQRLIKTIHQSEKLDAAVVLAFDAVYRRDGSRDDANTHLYVTNDYVMELANRDPKILFGASVHPYRKDAIQELERCVKAGAVLLKWLPITQSFNPADPICFPFYEALAHYKLTLLSHTGWEHALPNLDKTVADPMLLKPALDRGVKVIAAHCGSRLMPWEQDFVPQFMQLACQYEHFYGDTAALNVPNRWYAFSSILSDSTVRQKLVHGSDWPILSVPPPTRVGAAKALKFLQEPNWMCRDILIKEALGFDDSYWHRGAKVLGLTP